MATAGEAERVCVIVTFVSKKESQQLACTPVDRRVIDSGERSPHRAQ